MQKDIIYFGEPAKIACDEKCNKAWGIQLRPKVYLDLNNNVIYGYGYKDDRLIDEDIDFDNYAYCSDEELGEAPDNPGTSEGWQYKPITDDEKGNKWCARQCERCVMSELGKFNEPLVLPDFSKRRYNCPTEQC